MDSVISKRTELLKNFASALVLAAPLAGFAFPSTSLAACTIAAGAIANGQTTTCTGTFSEENYSIGARTNVTIINEGTWTETGNLQSNLNASMIGPQNTSINYTGLQVINNGSLTWTNASATNIAGAGNRTMAVLGSYMQSLSRGSSYINNGTIYGVTAATNLSTFAGIGNVGRSGTLYSENAGSIYIDASRVTNAAGAGIGMATFGGSHSIQINSGDIAVVGGNRFSSGIDYTYDSSFAAYRTGIIEVDNSGTIDVTTTGADGNGIGVWITDNVASPTLSQISLVNSGTITVSSVSGAISGIFVQSNIGGVPIEIHNTGLISSTGHSIMIGAPTPAAAYILNEGTLIGDVQTSLGNDTYDQTGGQLRGALRLGAGSDRASFVNTNISPTTLLDGGDDVSTADGMIDTLTFSGVSANTTGARLQNWENIIIENGRINITDGALTTGSDAGTGLTVRSGGTLDGGNALALTGNMFLQSGGRFLATGGGSGVYTISGSVTNAGVLSSRDVAAGDRITIAGPYTGAGGTVELDTALGADASPTDLLTLSGGSSGTSNLRIVNAGGNGALTANGIKVIDVNGASDGRFTLLGNYTFNGTPAVVGGAYAYRLYRNGVSTPGDGDWYLRSVLIETDPPGPPNPGNPHYQEGVPVFEVYPQILLGLNGLPTLQQRVGNRYWSGNGAGVAAQGADAVGEPPMELAGVPAVEGRGVWGRIELAHRSLVSNDSITDTDYSTYDFKMQTGIDVPLSERETGTLLGGVTLQYARASADVSSYFGDGSINANGFGLGGTLTWYANNGFYLDGQAQVTLYDTSLGSDGIGSFADPNATGYSISIEGGHRIDLNNGLTLTPQAQLQYSAVNFEDFNQIIAGNPVARISPSDAESLRGRVGISVDSETSWQAENGLMSRRHIYGIANLYYEFMGDTNVNVSGVNFASSTEEFWGGIGFGGSYNWDDDKYSVYGEGSINTSLADFGDNYAVKGTAGLRVKW
ncbi:MAG: autotransporter outer membrane beta-barrel domain-containing protein [Rhizobiaceae bacterium]|nr:autotransporter outer membrane beta-barrel domain-containing protein [Rhizobiaceae bacterium]